MNELLTTEALIVLGLAISAAWVITTWLRVKNGYPLENSWGKAVYPRDNAEAKQRVTLLTQENAELRAEIGSMKDRLANVERIVTDSGYHLTHEIDRLRDNREKKEVN
ncbi:hypothetical protein [Altererythrobacter sp. GH1-8]|uniref:hypothetical protein n=1 Tax=Altererythrobacter sp. GH1-8 TaxID=3349333 RepID=UPI00374DA2B2